MVISQSKKKWTKADENKLIILIEKGHKSKSIAKNLNYSQSSVDARLPKLRKREPRIQRPTFKKWSKEEEDQLADLKQKKRTVPSMASEMGRTKSSIKNKKHELANRDFRETHSRRLEGEDNPGVTSRDDVVGNELNNTFIEDCTEKSLA